MENRRALSVLLVFLLFTAGCAAKSKIPNQNTDLAVDGLRGSVRTGETELVIAVNGGGEDCGSSSCSGEMRLDIELRAVGRMLDSIETSGLSVGVVSNALSENTAWGETIIPISRHPSSVKPELFRVYRVGGALLNLGELLDQATIELARLQGCTSSGLRAERKRVLLFVNETPLLPYGPSFVDDNLKAGGRAAQRAARAKIKIFAIAFMPLERRVAAELHQIAETTDGRYVAVSSEEELSHMLAIFVAEWSKEK